jgi:hypothetical protein
LNNGGIDDSNNKETFAAYRNDSRPYQYLALFSGPDDLAAAMVVLAVSCSDLA